jgi:3',5'-cyclic AMP phosphodiesterase CpdA
MNVIKTTLSVGAEKPFRVLHATDTHLTYADLRDGERKVELAQKRTRIFPNAPEVLDFAAQTAKELSIPILHTGDLIDFVSIANLEAAKRFTDENDCFMAAGNHEFSLYVGEAKEDAAYREKSLAEVQKAFKNDIRMSARVIGGVNFVALDNGYYLFEQAQLDFLKAEVKKGLPVVLLLHNPLYEQGLYDLITERSPCAYLVAVPEALMQHYPADRYAQQMADDVTRETVDYIANEPQIKAIIAGHLHRNYEGVFADRIPQILTCCTDLRLFEIV